MRVARGLLTLVSSLLAVAVSMAPAAAQFSIGGDPRVNPGDFEITTFASGLNFPNGLALLPDGSLLVATSTPGPPAGFFTSSAELYRFVDSNGDGVADGPGTLMFSDTTGVLTSLRVAGNLIFTTSAKNTLERISILRMPGGPASPYSLVGSLDFAFPSGWEHKSYALAVRPAPGAPAGTWELYFNIGSTSNGGQSAATVGLSGLITGALQGASIYRVTVTETPTGASVSSLTLIATGLRNAAGMDFHPTTGDFYFEENGIDGFVDRTEPESADELNRIAAGSLGVTAPNFGFPNDYIKYRTGARVGSGGVQPLVTFQPIPMPNGSESEGASGIAFAPSGFPSGLNNGVFIGFHGQFSLGGASNEENAVVFYDLATGQYFHFIENRQLGHPNTLLTTSDSLFVADLSTNGPLSAGNTGAIYRIKRRTSPPPPLVALFTSPGAGAPVSGTVTVGMAETGANGMPITFTLTVDGAQVFTVSGAAPSATFSWDTNTVAVGSHTLELTVRDGAGGTAIATRMVTVQRSTGTLKVFITSPAANSTVSGSPWSDVWVEGASGTRTFTLSIGDTQLATVGSSTVNHVTLNWDSRRVPNGNQTLTATVSDGTGNTGTGTRAFNVQNAGPAPLVPAFTSPAAGATVSGSVTIGMSETGASGTPITFTLAIDGVERFRATGTATTASFPWDTSAAAAGSHTLTLTVSDGAGRTVTTTRNVTVQGAPPLVASFVRPADGTTVTGSVLIEVSETGANGTPIAFTVTVDGTQILNVSGPATSASFSWDSTTVADGNRTLVVTVRDGANRAATATRSISVANGPPSLVASFTSPAAGAVVSGTVPVGMSATNASGTPTVFTLTVDGVDVFTTSVATTTASFNWDTNGAAVGTRTLGLTVRDGAGRSVTTTRAVTVQRAGTLKVFITSPAENSRVAGSVWSDVWVEGAGAGTRTFTLSIGSTQLATATSTGNHVTLPWNSLGAANGMQVLTATVRDAAANSGTGTRTFDVENPDAPPPLVASFTSPANGITVNGNVTVGMSQNGANGTPIAFTLTVDGTQVFNISGPAASASFTWDTRTVNNGVRVLALTVRDGAGRTASTTRSVTVDNPPGIERFMVSFTSPTEGATVSSTVTVGMSATFAASTPITFTLSIDGVQVFSTGGTPTTASYTWNTTAWSNGTHTLQLSGRDGAGQTATATRTVTVGQPSVPISVFITGPASDGAAVSGVMWFTVWIDKAAAGSKTYSLSVNGTVLGTTTTTSNGPVSVRFDSTAVSNGSQVVTVSVRDSAGATGSANRRVTVAN
jgi:glucose/arabinose dehydrogenase